MKTGNPSASTKDLFALSNLEERACSAPSASAGTDISFSKPKA
jgi:hypothetical protein